MPRVDIDFDPKLVAQTQLFHFQISLDDVQLLLEW